MIKPIETSYNGYKFRSRIEARWAMFFDALGLPYDYEVEGFELEDGTWYLPDFWMPDLDCWLEVKGEKPTGEEEEKAGMLSRQSGKDVFIAFGPMPYPHPDPGDLSDSLYLYRDGAADNYYLFCECPTCHAIGVEYCGRADRMQCKTTKGCPKRSPNKDKDYQYDTPRLMAAYEAARSARF